MEGLDFLPEDMVLSFSDLTQLMVDKVTGTLQQSQTAEEPRFIIPFFSGHGGCNDAFSGFGFLAFLLALLDLILELQDDGVTRKRRDLSGWSEDASLMDLQESESPGWSACYSMYRGFLNALATTDAACANRFLCEGSEEAAATGTLGQMIANVASINAATWLLRENSTRYKGAAEAGLVGAQGGLCSARFPHCSTLPPTYSYPRVYTGDPVRDFRIPGIHDL
ncbi:uncharacterized protein [Panulirus ornatus]|uniref:uncharacterized protein n=1 Tax=Panulirus ornatus TaxID=150431 RepID=UPI003A890988